MHWKVTDVSKVLGVEPFVSRNSTLDDIYVFDFSGPLMKYGV